MSEKKPRLFISNPDSGEPACYIGDGDDLQAMTTPLGHFTQAEVQSMLESGDKSITIEITRQDMTDEEVANLPDW